MKSLRIPFLAIAGVAALLALALQIDPAEKVKELNDLRTQRLNDARTTGTPVDFDALTREIAERAQAHVAGIDPAAVEPKLGLSWAQLFVMAQRHADARTTARRFIDHGDPGAAEKLQAQLLILDSSNALRDGAAIAGLLPTIVRDGDPVTVVRVAPMYVSAILRTSGPEQALKTIEEVTGLIRFDGVPQPQQDGFKVNIALAKSDALQQLGRKDEGLAILRAAIDDLGADNAGAARLQSVLTQREMIGKPAPGIEFGEKYGEFTSLSDLRGKVVILSFFAHW